MFEYSAMSVTVLASDRPMRRSDTGEPARFGPAGGAERRSDSSGLRPLLPVLPPLRPLLPGEGLRRGSVVSVRDGVGSTSLLLALMAGVSAAGGWCAVVGLPALGPPAAVELGIDAERLVMVPDPGPRWASVVAGLLEGFDVVALRPGERVRSHDARRLVGRAREHGAVLMVAGAWEGAELRMSTATPGWHGVGEGHGHLRARRLTVRVEGRGAAARPREGRLWLPGMEGGCSAVGDPVVTDLPLAGGLGPRRLNGDRGTRGA